jgi:hypothetical protein
MGLKEIKGNLEKIKLKMAIFKAIFSLVIANFVSKNM